MEAIGFERLSELATQLHDDFRVAAPFPHVVIDDFLPIWVAEALAKEFTQLPVCVGFGISKPEHGRAGGEFADGVVVGSAIVDLIEAAGSRDEAVDSVAGYVSEMKDALR